jgi:8-oxo-dGTP pyrophosphatase MutT (NUDIX family)
MTKAAGKIPTLTQVSAGGAVIRNTARAPEVALISVGDPARWQLPKGIVDKGETAELAAIREVREEAGVEATITDKIETVEYWYQSTVAGKRTRYHKFVHFFQMDYVSGDVADHDHEVHEAKWFDLANGLEIIAFKSERGVLQKVADRLAKR